MLDIFGSLCYTINKAYILNGVNRMERKYISRIADRLLAERLEASSAVLVKGPKWCDKTWTSLEASKSHSFMNTICSLKVQAAVIYGNQSTLNHQIGGEIIFYILKFSNDHSISS